MNVVYMHVKMREIEIDLDHFSMETSGLPAISRLLERSANSFGGSQWSN